jgi:energy-coupling factor transporter ATP-binding protein EcfA2
MRITQIDLQNFRAFRHSHEIKLDRTGKNLILYGENGSGKSSFFLALRQFLYSSLTSERIDNYRNIFTPNDEAIIRFHIVDTRNPNNQPTPYEWSISNPSGHHQQIIREAATASGFLDYRCLLETHFLTPAGDRVNIFNILVNVLLANIRNDVTQNTFANDWQSITNGFPPRRNSRQAQDLESRINDFNSGLVTKLQALKDKLVNIFGRFGYYDVGLDFDFPGVAYNPLQNTLDRQQVILKVQFFSQDIHHHHKFLNEAKLSAIGLSIYLAALRLNPLSRPDRFKILVLDDVLIGLDMSNRLPIIKILQDFFSDYQIFLLTHDLEWYEILKQRLDQDTWKPVDLYCTKGIEYEVPVVAENKDYLTKAQDYLTNHDYKAAAIYLRTAFEHLLKRYCDKKGLPVKYKEKAKVLTSDDFWAVVKPHVPSTLADEVEHARELIMNPLSHSRIISVYPAEVNEAIDFIKRLKQELQL